MGPSPGGAELIGRIRERMPASNRGSQSVFAGLRIRANLAPKLGGPSMGKVSVLMFAIALAVAAPAASSFAADAVKADAAGKCHDAKGKFTKCPPAAPAKVCKKSKPCGNACIAQDKVCHKPA